MRFRMATSKRNLSADGRAPSRAMSSATSRLARPRTSSPPTIATTLNSSSWICIDELFVTLEKRIEVVFDLRRQRRHSCGR